jgi:O-antigen/teichoic acid export membrane protein
VALTLPLLLLVAACLFFAGGPLVRQVLRIPSHLQATTLTTLRLGAVILIASAMSGILNTSQIVRLRMDLNSRITMTASFTQLVCLLAAVWLGGKVIAVLCVLAVLTTGVAVANAVISSRLSPGVMRPRIDPRLIPPMARFGIGIVATALIGTVTVYGEKFLIVRAGSVSMLAYYSIASTFAGLLGIFPAAMSQSLMPSFVHLRSHPDPVPMEKLHGDLLRGVLLCSLPAAVILSISAPLFLSHWAGPEYGRESVVPAYILLVGWVFQAMVYIPKNLLAASDRIGVIARYQAFGVVPYLAVALLLIRIYGVAGAAASWTLRCIGETVVFFILARKLAGLRCDAFEGKSVKLGAAFACLGVPLGFAAAAASPGVVWLAAGGGILAYGTIVFKGLLSQEQKNWVSQTLFSRRR